MNIKLCFPEMDETERHHLLLAALTETGKTVTETGPLWLWPGGRVLGLVRAVSGEDGLATALAAGKGVILAIPHLGSWEMVGLYCSARYPMTSLYRPPRMPALETFVSAARARLGARLVPTGHGGARALYRALDRGELVAILPDQEPKRGAGVFAPFFGIPAYTMTLLARLAQRSGAPVFFAYAERLPAGAGFHLHFVPAPAGIADLPAGPATAAINAGIEECVRNVPAQYQWSYKRFETRPDSEPNPYR